MGVMLNSPNENVGLIVNTQNSVTEDVQKRTMSFNWKSNANTIAGSGAVLIPRINWEEGSSVWGLCITTKRSSATASPSHLCLTFKLLRIFVICFSLRASWPGP